MSKDALNLDFLLEPVVPAGKVQFAGQEYELFQVDVLENLLTLMAMVEKTSKTAQLNPDCLPEEMERLRQEFRNMIRVILPGMPEEVLKEKLPKLTQLQGFFSAVVTEAYKRLPESVKKNCEATHSKDLKAEAEPEKSSS